MRHQSVCTFAAKTILSALLESLLSDICCVITVRLISHSPHKTHVFGNMLAVVPPDYNKTPAQVSPSTACLPPAFF